MLPVALGRLLSNLRPKSAMSLKHALESYEAGVGGTIVIQIAEKPGQPPEVFFATTPLTLIAGSLTARI